MSALPDAIAMCSHPDGLHEHVPAEHVRNATCFADCDCTPRTYVAVDAMLGDDVLAVACRAGHDAYEERSRAQGHVSGSPVPWEDVPEPYRSATIAGYKAGLHAAVTRGAGQR